MTRSKAGKRQQVYKVLHLFDTWYCRALTKWAGEQCQPHTEEEAKEL